MTYFIGYGLRTNKGVDFHQGDRDLFFDKLVNLIEQVSGEVLFAGTGTGIWEGNAEPAGSITFIVPDVPDNEVHDFFAQHLVDLAIEFEQDSIAFTNGNTLLVQANGELVLT